MSTLSKQLRNLQFTGIDANLETSLFNYGIITAPFADPITPQPDEYFCIYSIGNDRYDTGYLAERELDAIILGEEWMNSDDIESFLDYNGNTLDEWLQLAFIQKLHSLLSYYGYENIFDATYHAGLTEKETRKFFK